MVSFRRKNKKLDIPDYPGGSYIAETSQSAGPHDDEAAEPDVRVDASFLDEPVNGYPEASRSKARKSFILTGRSAIILGGLGLVIAVWAFFVGLFIGLGFLLEDKAFIRVKAMLSDKLSSENPAVGAIPEVEKEILSLLAGKQDDSKPKTTPSPPPAPPTPPNPPAVKTPPPPTGGKFAVQVAATHTEAEAEKLVADLEKKGFKAYFFKATVNDRSYYRVRVGHFDTRAEAKESMNKLDGHGFEGMFIWRLEEES